MNKLWNTIVACAAVAALGVIGCERRNEDMRPVDRDRNIGDRAEDTAERTGNRAEDTLDRTGDRLEQAGKDMTGGITYEVAKIDKEAKTVELRRSNNMIGVTDKKDLQAGMDSLTMTFDELGNYVEGDKPGHEIADELHKGENVNVFMDANKKITKITY